MLQRPFVKLFPSTDTDGSTIYVGRWKWPGKIDFSKGVAFLVYTAVKGQEELHLCPLTSPDLSNVFEYYNVQKRDRGRNRNSNLTVLLEPRFEPHGEKRKFYIGKVAFDGVIDCGVETPGVVFLVFVADDGEEQLQITVLDPNKMGKRKRISRTYDNEKTTNDDIQDDIVDGIKKNEYLDEDE
jgi:hypothetical protein